MDCVCMYIRIQANGMCYATHVCVWRMQMDLLKRIYTVGPSLKIEMWVEASWGRVVRSLHWMSLDPDMFVLHDLTDLTLNVYCMTQRWPLMNFCTLWPEAAPPPSPPASLSLCNELFPSFNTFGLAHFIFHTALLSLGCVFSWRDLIHSCNCSPLLSIMDTVAITGFPYTTNTFVNRSYSVHLKHELSLDALL